jgi:hypothetical protein
MEPLNEMEDTLDDNGVKQYLPIALRFTNKLIFSNERKNFKNTHRRSQYQRDSPLFVLFAATLKDSFPQQEEKPFVVRDNLPPNVKLSIRSYDYNEYVIRFHNMDDIENRTFEFYKEENNVNYVLSQYVQPHQSVIVTKIEELGLSQNQLRSDVLKNKWRYREFEEEIDFDELLNTDYRQITLRPLELRTFLLQNVSINLGADLPTITTSIEEENEDYDDETAPKKPEIPIVTDPANTTDIITNSTDVTTNSTDVTTNSTDVTTNSTDVTTNSTTPSTDNSNSNSSEPTVLDENVDNENNNTNYSASGIVIQTLEQMAEQWGESMPKIALILTIGVIIFTILFFIACRVAWAIRRGRIRLQSYEEINEVSAININPSNE